jgi:hypothetical protein
MGASVLPLRIFRLRLLVLDDSRWLRAAPVCVSLPVAVLRNRLATDFLVFIFGIIHAPDSYRFASRRLGCRQETTCPYIYLTCRCQCLFTFLLNILFRFLNFKCRFKA